MSTFTRTAALWGLASTLLAPAIAAIAAPPEPRRATGPVAPEQFGRVFRRAKPSIVQVRTASGARAFDIGTLVGANGELVFGARVAPRETVWIRAGSGRDREARVLGYAAAAGLALARLPAIEGQLLEPMPAAEPGDLALEQWVVTVRLDGRGKPEPFAGVVERTERPHAKDPSLGIVQVAAPAQHGSPIFAADGGLVAFAIERGDRRAQAVLLSSLAPFLRKVALGP